MAIYSLAQRATISTIATAPWCMQTPSGTEVALLEWGYINAAATAAVTGIGKSNNQPVITGPVNFLAEDFRRPAGLTQSGVAFGTAPTVPLQFFRRFQLAALVGAAVAYTFPRGVVTPALIQGFTAWNITANPAIVDIYAVVDE